MKTAKIRFDLESRLNKHGQSLIILNMSYGYKEYNVKTKEYDYSSLKLSTKKTIKKSDWDSDNYRPTKKYIASKGSTLKNYLDKLSSDCEHQLDLYFNEHNKLPHPNELKTIIKTKLGRIKAKTNDSSITRFIETFVIENEKLTLTAPGRIGEKQIGKYNNIYKLIEGFESEAKESITFENFNKDKFLDLLDYANELYKDDSNPYGYLVNTVSKIASTIKAILKKAQDGGVNLALNLTDRHLNINDVKAMDADVFLSEESLSRVIKTDTLKSIGFTHAKNYIIICSFTSLRFEDMAELHNVEVNDYQTGKIKFKGFITPIRKGTNPTNPINVCVPVFKPVQDILDSNGGRFPKFPNNAELNIQLKKFAKHIGLTEKFDIEKWYYKMDEPVIVQKHLHELIKCHIGRSTFVSNLMMKGINNSYIEYITHPTKKTTTLEKYYDKTALTDRAALLVKEVREKAPDSLYIV